MISAQTGSNMYARPVGGDMVHITNMSNNREEHSDHVQWTGALVSKNMNFIIINIV